MGEAIDECLIREIKEEICTEPLEYEHLGHMEKFRNLDGIDTHWLGFYYKCLVDPTKVKLDNEEECDKTVWASFHDHQTPMMTGFVDTYAKFKDKF